MVFGKIMITMCFLFFYGPPGPELLPALFSIIYARGLYMLWKSGLCSDDYTICFFSLSVSSPPASGVFLYISP